MTQGPLTGEDREFAGNLLDIAAHWCDEGMRLGAEFAQAFVEATADVQLESAVAGGRARRSGTMVARRYGTGLLLRHRGAWWYGSAPLASPGELAERMAAIPGLGTPRPARPWHDISPAEARELAWDGLPPDGQAAGPPGGHTQVQFIQDYFRQYRAVADSAGVRRSWRVGGGRQRATATIVSGGTRARSFARRASADWGEPGTGDDLAACAGDLVSAAVGRAGCSRRAASAAAAPPWCSRPGSAPRCCTS